MTSLARWPGIAASRVRVLSAVTPSRGVTP